MLFALALTTVFASQGGALGETVWPETDQVYYLPYQYGFNSLCVQGNYGILSHTQLNKAAVDFLMPIGTDIVAAKCGVVTKVITSNKRTIFNYFTCPNNEIIIRSDDGMYARYVHLQYDATPEVCVGQYVEQGQFIAYSGNSGNSMAPHLHFEVYSVNESGGQQFMIARFIDIAGNDGIPTSGNFYRSGNILGLTNCY
jgi:murein DD-endopeptidase MepM/ murein hydrolase activator NlpD